MKISALIAALLALLAGFAEAQQPASAPPAPRDAVSLGNGTSTDAIASAGDHSIAFWTNGVDEDVLRYSTADGRGLAWTPWQSLSNDYGFADEIAVAMTPDRLVVLHTEGESSPASTRLFARRSTDGGATWGSKVALPLTTPGLTDGAFVLDVAIDTDPAGDRVYALIQDAPGQLTVRRSLNGGHSFTTSVPLTTTFAGSAELALAGGAAHVAFTETAGPDLRAAYRRSLDEGVSFEPTVPLDVIDPGANWEDIQIAADGPNVLVGVFWSSSTVRTHASTNGGANFGPGVTVPTQSVSSEGHDVLLCGDDAFCAWVGQTPTGPFFMRAGQISHAPDVGQSWSAPAAASAESANKFGILLHAIGDGAVATTHANSTATAALWSVATGTFSPYFTAVGQTTLEVLSTVNEAYGNTLVLFDGFDNQCWVGGFRPQTLTASGVVAGPSTASFAVERFDLASPAAWVVLSLAPGDTLLPDGRNLGLVFDALSLTSLDLAGAGFLAAPLDPTGAGATPAVPVGLPPGLTMFAVGVGFDLATGTIGALTDVLTLST